MFKATQKYRINHIDLKQTHHFILRDNSVISRSAGAGSRSTSSGCEEAKQEGGRSFRLPYPFPTHSPTPLIHAVDGPWGLRMPDRCSRGLWDHAGRISTKVLD